MKEPERAERGRVSVLRAEGNWKTEGNSDESSKKLAVTTVK